MLAFIGMMGTTEALLLGAKAGVDPRILREVVEASSGASFVWNSGTRAILRDRLAPSFTNALACKDIGLAVDLAEEFEVPVPMGRRTQQLLEQYRDNGFADEDVLATIRFLEEEADFVVRGLAPDVS
jgi:3-hydroxyisobutyrate dehydrogenase-like beta-hydroxyacid dehydrogenase